jgi:beta-phosphoglucomutase family hydrolase
MGEGPKAIRNWPRTDAAIFDTDGVITRTATVHAAAWKALFDEYLAARSAAANGERIAFAPFTDEDYRRYVDGVPRYDGVTRFLASRGIVLPVGEPSDPPGDATVAALGNRKNAAFVAELERTGVAPFETTVALVHALRASGVAIAAISASENAGAVLASAGVADLFDVRVDGIDARQQHLAGKPDPAIFLEAANRLGVEPSRAAVIEDALAGVEAGRAGGFGLVVGVDRAGHAHELRDAGADVVVADLGELGVGPDGAWQLIEGGDR